MKQEIFTHSDKGFLEKIGTAMTLQAGRILYLEGDWADRIYYIKKGRVRVFRNISSGREVTIDVVEAGHIVGESAFVKGGLRPTCVQAVNMVQLLSIKVTDLLPHLQQEPKLLLHFLQQSSKTMDRLTNRLQEQCLLDRYGKVASFLLDLASTDSPEKGTEGGIIPYTHENIADSLGLSRSTVTIVLREFEGKGWIRNGYRHVQVLDSESLGRFVQEQKEK